MILRFKTLHIDAIEPTRGSKKASGMDLYALQDTDIPANSTIIVKTGIAFDIPEGYEIQVRARSGLSYKTGLRLANGIGTVDQDYQGDCSVIFHNTSDSDYMISKGDRIAQAVLCPVVIPELVETFSFNIQTDRGESGFGSTGE